MNRFKEMKKYRDKINALIKERPNLQEFQDHIDSELKKAGNNTHNRLAVMENLIYEYKSKLHNKMKDLNVKIDKVKKGFEGLRDDR